MGMCWRLRAEGFERFEHDHGDVVLLQIPSGLDEYGDMEAWCARLKGVDPAHQWLRVFCSPVRVRDGEVCMLEFELRYAGGYECRESEDVASRYLWFDGEELSELDMDTMRERVRGGATRAEVDVACQHELWEEAERLAGNMADEEARGEALVAIRTQRDARDASGLRRLLGTPKQRQWAARIREHALVRFTALEDAVLGQESATLSTPIEASHLEQAMNTIRCEQRATFWIEVRDVLDAHADVHFIEALISSERLDIIEESRRDEHEDT